MTSIIVPLDGSAESEYALAVARTLAELTACTVTLLRVQARGSGTGRASGTLTQDEIIEYLLALGRRTCDPAGITYEVLAPDGDAAREITAAAGGDVRAIVMTTHGRSGFARWRLGSVADRVARTSPVPTVLVCPQPNAGLHEIRTVLLPLDGSATSEAALPAAVMIADTTGARLVLLRAARGVPALFGTDGSQEEVDAWVEADPTAYLTRVAEGLPGRAVEARVVTAEAVTAIKAAAQEADLIVMGTHSRSGLRRVALGSVTDAVVRTAGRPVMVVRTDQMIG